MKASQTTIATTVAGILAGLTIIAQQVSQMVNEGTPINWLSVVLAASIMVLGVFSKGIGNGGAPPVPPAALVLLFMLPFALTPKARITELKGPERVTLQ